MSVKCSNTYSGLEPLSWLMCLSMKIVQLFANVDALDKRAMLIVQKWRIKPVTVLLTMITYSGMGVSWFAVAIILALLNYIKLEVITDQQLFFRSMLGGLFAWVSGLLLKSLVKRRRPIQSIEGFSVCVKSPLGESFPSNHAATSVSLLVAQIFLQHPLALMVGVWAVLICLSRLYLGNHYPSDILSGIILGVICGFPVQFINLF